MLSLSRSSPCPDVRSSEARHVAGSGAARGSSQGGAMGRFSGAISLWRSQRETSMGLPVAVDGGAGGG